MAGPAGGRAAGLLIVTGSPIVTFPSIIPTFFGGSTHWAHINLMVKDGITMVENMKLDELAADRQYEFVLLCFPLKFEGATGAPVCPIALA